MSATTPLLFVLQIRESAARAWEASRAAARKTTPNMANLILDISTGKVAEKRQLQNGKFSSQIFAS
jgi:hypothetical protein